MNSNKYYEIVIHEYMRFWNESIYLQKEKYEELLLRIWRPPPTEKSNEQQTWQHKNATKNFDCTTIADRLRTVSWSNDCKLNGLATRLTPGLDQERNEMWRSLRSKERSCDLRCERSVAVIYAAKGA